MRGEDVPPPVAAVITMARGVAICAFEHSSARWNGASYPDMVQMMETKLMRMAMPLGHSVPLVWEGEI